MESLSSDSIDTIIDSYTLFQYKIETQHNGSKILKFLSI